MNSVKIPNRGYFQIQNYKVFLSWVILGTADQKPYIIPLALSSKISSLVEAFLVFFRIFLRCV